MHWANSTAITRSQEVLLEEADMGQVTKYPKCFDSLSLLPSASFAPCRSNSVSFFTTHLGVTVFALRVFWSAALLCRNPFLLHRPCQEVNALQFCFSSNHSWELRLHCSSFHLWPTQNSSQGEAVTPLSCFKATLVFPVQAASWGCLTHGWVHPTWRQFGLYWKAKEPCLLLVTP